MHSALYYIYAPDVHIHLPSQVGLEVEWRGKTSLGPLLMLSLCVLSPLRPPTSTAAAVNSYSICLQMTQAFLNHNYLGNSLSTCFYSQEFFFYAFWLTCLLYCIYRFSIAIYLLKKLCYLFYRASYILYLATCIPMCLNLSCILCISYKLVASSRDLLDSD